MTTSKRSITHIKQKPITPIKQINQQLKTNIKQGLNIALSARVYNVFATVNLAPNPKLSPKATTPSKTNKTGHPCVRK